MRISSGGRSPAVAQRFVLPEDAPAAEAWHVPLWRGIGRMAMARRAVLLLFVDPPADTCSLLQSLTAGEWKQLLRWLDYSGLALYLLHRMTELELLEWLPSGVLARLEQNLIDNTARTRSMIAESVAIQRELQKAQLTYAVSKGISLWPIAVPNPELRSQFDLDFLVAERCAQSAQAILERRGYRLYGISGRSWEFKRNEKPGVGLKDLYTDMPSYAVELHLEPDQPGSRSRLARRERRTLYGIGMPVLSPVDLFLGQGLHAFKHVCGEYSRASHLLEFRRHILARGEDALFWDEVRHRASGDPRAWVGLGVVTLLVSQEMGEFAPTALTHWTVQALPSPVQRWVAKYGRRALMGSHPGSKLYLILEEELRRAGISAGRPTRRALVPSRFPPAVVRGLPRERLPVRLRRYRMQCGFLLARLHFHVVEGIRYAWEAYRWQR